MSAEVDQLRETLREYFSVRTVTPLGGGVTNRTYEVNGDLVARVARQPDEQDTRYEVDVLATVRAATDTPVPEPLVVVAHAGLTVYRKLPGSILSELPRDRRAVGDVVSTLDRLRRDIAPIRVGRTDVASAAEWLADARASYRVAADRVPVRLRPAVERFLADDAGPAPSDQLVFCHNDLGAEHILVDTRTGRVTGIIDWADAAMADPASDTGRLLRDFGMRTIQPDPRAVFFARCQALEDLAYGMGPGRQAYAENALAALHDLFAG
ncbi:aminoglycoside phosphotransferase family protein [Asanoa sp. WMMD1127]|uniref:phosphotransferase family protein n=1 Tax=Asanoa sp. WMMD1127 TaxID=3016107 RepID=UPI0024171BF8|nr:aminoglycoside phosphotransferase family protein [Asanoa sp. WMMD1127]MDG4825081.1 aminoglycoside phosphotransferase family protein [Asanoa sp. WMMD1127]